MLVWQYSNTTVNEHLTEIVKVAYTTLKVAYTTL